jgi:serine/threonine protein kinase
MPSALTDDQLINGRYSLQREIGRGATGQVYAAWDHHLERDVAIKVLDPRLTHDPSVRNRFDREIRCTAQLQHPGLVAVYESAQLHDGTRCYIMSLARGRGLDSYIKELQEKKDHWKKASLLDRITLFLKILEVIKYAHSQHVVHRDLKPANIMLGSFGEVWILDWGLARNMRDEATGIETAFDDMFGGLEKATARITDTERLRRKEQEDARPFDVAATRLDSSSQIELEDGERSESTGIDAGTGIGTGTAVGTGSVGSAHAISRGTRFGDLLGSPAYMSPEQARGEAGAVDNRSDIYSLGVILFELLTLHAPCEMEHGERLMAFMKRIQSGKRQTLISLWPEAPRVLHDICERALAVDLQKRYPDCNHFAQEVRGLLARLSASYSELERQRLAKEREGAWNDVGSWDFRATPGLGPFTEPPRAHLHEAIGQVMHPELGGLLLGGLGIQAYPLGVTVSDDMRIVANIDIVQGSECWILLRGVLPDACYQIRVGAYGGRWVMIGRSEKAQSLADLPSETLVLHPLRKPATENRKRRSFNLVIEAVGSTLTLTIDDQQSVVVRDPCPLTGPLKHQVAFATNDSDVIVRQLMIQSRRSPLMMPAYSVGNELLRQGLFTNAIDAYRRFLLEHPNCAEAAEANFMLCLAFIRAGHVGKAEFELRDFLSRWLDHALTQNAIFELSRIVLQHSGSERAVRIVLSYQESGDFVRSQFCLLIMNSINKRIEADGVTESVIGDLELVRRLIQGSPDESSIIETLSADIAAKVRQHVNVQLDSGLYTDVVALRESVKEMELLGYSLPFYDKHTPEESKRIAAHLNAVDDVVETQRYLPLGLTEPIAVAHFIRDAVTLIHEGALDQVLLLLDRKPLRPIETILRAVVYRLSGRNDDATIDFQHCFQLTELLEIERTDAALLFAARLGCYALGFLPWKLIWGSESESPLDQITVPMKMLAAFVAESLGNDKEAAEMYRFGMTVGTGFRYLAQERLKKIEK